MVTVRSPPPLISILNWTSTLLIAVGFAKKCQYAIGFTYARISFPLALRTRTRVASKSVLGGNGTPSETSSLVPGDATDGTRRSEILPLESGGVVVTVTETFCAVVPPVPVQESM